MVRCKGSEVCVITTLPKWHPQPYSTPVWTEEAVKTESRSTIILVLEQPVLHVDQNVMLLDLPPVDGSVYPK
jgi:tRNA(Phe) wybutosine-synthesizing methylase Tyw3